ncbi:MAG: quinolinate synthase NadA [Gemmatimonadales bacterium]
MPIPTHHLSFTPTVARATDPVRARIGRYYPPAQWQQLAPYIHEINRLKAEKHAVVLAHHYMTPDIYYGVADVVGDSLALARAARNLDADVIIQAGVRFMAETSKLLNPGKTVLLPDTMAGCSLAESIAPADVARLRREHPGAPVVAYVNTSAAIKAESDICCTSGNALSIVNGLGAREVIMIPDRYLAQYVAARTDVTIHSFSGACEVHERFTAADVTRFRHGDAKTAVLAHPECPPDVLEAADFTGSTAQMIAWVQRTRPERVVMITECSMSDNVAAANPDIEFLNGCRMCPHMKRISLPKILDALRTMQTPIEIDDAIATRARRSVERMLDLLPQ